jgi:hypothetical protein
MKVVSERRGIDDVQHCRSIVGMGERCLGPKTTEPTVTKGGTRFATRAGVTPLRCSYKCDKAEFEWAAR